MRPPFFIRGLIAVPLMILGAAPALAQSRNDIDAWQARRDFERLNQQRITLLQVPLVALGCLALGARPLHAAILRREGQEELLFALPMGFQQH